MHATKSAGHEEVEQLASLSLQQELQASADDAQISACSSGWLAVLHPHDDEDESQLHPKLTPDDESAALKQTECWHMYFCTADGMALYRLMASQVG